MNAADWLLNYYATLADYYSEEDGYGLSALIPNDMVFEPRQECNLITKHHGLKKLITMMKVGSIQQHLDVAGCLDSEL